MYTVVRLYKIKAGGTFKEISDKVQDGFISIVSVVPGYVGYYMMDSGNSTMSTISIFDDQAGAYESTAAAAKWNRANIGELVELPPTVIAGEATIHHTK